MLTLLTAFTMIGCEEAERKQTSAQSERIEKLTDLSAEELAKLTFTRGKALGAEYSDKEFQDYDAAILAHGPVYKRHLIEHVRHSDDITITEHSDRMDFFDVDSGFMENPPFYEYRHVRLTEEQRSGFLAAIESMESATVTSSSMCYFEPHHRLEFSNGEGDPSIMSICFKCGQVRWDEVDLVHPEGLFDALLGLLEAVGFEAEKDWKALAEERSAQGDALKD